MKKNLVFLLLVLSLVLSIGCRQEQQPKLNWSVTLVEQQVKDELEQVDEVRQYDGSIAKVAHKNSPAEGKQFLLLHLALKKNTAGNNGFKWNQLELQGQEKFQREKDVYLSDYKYKRLPATELKLDAQGWICYEIPKGVKVSELRLIYRENGQENIIKLK